MAIDYAAFYQLYSSFYPLSYWDALTSTMFKDAAKRDHAGEVVLIPRIELSPKDGEFPFQWQRRQFPVRPAFAITINKAQGQTLTTVGVWLQDPVFTHGQLYVAASRVGDPGQLLFAIKLSDNRTTRDVVYGEALL